MINLMYLVLTAMLALNVSSEILHAFKVINNSINNSNTSIDGKNAELLAQFAANEELPGQKERVKPFNDKAKRVHAASDKMNQYLEAWKERIIQRAGGYNAEKEIKNESNIDASTFLLVEQKGGDTIKRMLSELYTEFLNEIDDPNVRQHLEPQLPIKIVEMEKTESNPKGDWKMGMFHNLPTLAAVTMFSKMQNDVRNSEAMIIEQLFKDADAKQIKIDAIQAIAMPGASYVMAGEKVNATILLAAYNTTINPKVTPSSGVITKTEDGVAVWETTASGVGLQTVRGTLSYDLGGQNIQKDWKFEYMVGSKGGSIQLDKMNVFYIGVPNPVTISAAGYSIEDVRLTVPDAEVTPVPSRSKGSYDVTVTKPGEVIASIIAKKRAGGEDKVIETKVRVKVIPDPVATCGGKFDGLMGSNVFKAQLGILADLKQFDFDVKFQIVSFSYMIKFRGSPDLVGPFTFQGPLFSSNADANAARARMKPGDKIWIEEIKAVGPDKRVRSLNPISLTLN
jgi:gliding motility-associated protein GldM